MKTKEKYITEKKDLEGYYKFVCICENCGIFYGRDFEREQTNRLCPFCEQYKYLRDREKESPLIYLWDEF